MKFLVDYEISLHENFYYRFKRSKKSKSKIYIKNTKISCYYHFLCLALTLWINLCIRTIITQGNIHYRYVIIIFLCILAL